MFRHVHLILPAALILLIGVAHGYVSGRWTENHSLHSISARVNALDPVAEGWTAETFELGEQEAAIGEISASVNRVYRHDRTGVSAGIMLLTGKSGPISLHPPTACFAGRGYRVNGETGIVTVAAPDSGESYEFHFADFSNPDADDPSLIRVWWAWSTDGMWKASHTPRVEFAGQPFLCKLYVSERWIPDAAGESGPGAAPMLMPALLPQIESAIRGQGESSETDPADVPAAG